MYVKNALSKVVINTDDSYYRTILAHRAEQQKVKKITSEMDSLRGELDDIKRLLQKVIDKDG